MRWSQMKALVLWMLIWCMDVEEVCACDMESCIKGYGSREQTLRRGPHLPYCVHLQEYLECIEGQSKACHGNIMFHGAESSVQTMIAKEGCEKILKDGNVLGEDGKLLPNLEVNSTPQFPSDDPCHYKGSLASPAHCGLFGDPHLKTFNGTFMTCKVKGAWPMVSSSHLTIQVTNEAVAPDFKATATTKVTVLIKENEMCGSAKTYEASGDSLPKAFVDGTTFSGADRLRPFADVTESLSGLHVLIKIRSINAVVSIRKVGSYLSVSATIPREVARELSDDMQLCVGGCPRSEQLTEGAVQGYSSRVMSEDKALSLCLERNITDYYLDSCVFDLVTTGDLAFREAASLSLKDAWTEDPKTSFSVLRNCSHWPCVWKGTSGNSQVTGTSYGVFSIMGLGWFINLYLIGELVTNYPFTRFPWQSS